MAQPSPVAPRRFVAHGGHDAHRVPPQQIGLRIEASMAFGTGHHGTTQGCLLLLDRIAKRSEAATRVADIGCGTGVLAMAAARLWRARCIATDIDAVAVRTARENAAANGLSPWILTAQAAGLRSGLLRRAAPHHLVFANILAQPLKRLAPDIARQLAPRGIAILSGLLTPQAAGVAAVYAGHRLVVVDRVEIGGWTSLALRRV